MNLKSYLRLLADIYKEWNEDKVPRLAAALAYHTIFSLAPLLVILVAIAGLVFGEDAARGEITAQFAGLIGQEGARFIEQIIMNASQPADGLIATIIGLLVLLLGASGVFGQLQDALNTVWEVKPRDGGGLLELIKNRSLSFTIVLGSGFLLMVSLVLSAALSAASRFVSSLLPGSALVWRTAELAVSFAVVALIFAVIFKVLPDVEIRWSNVWVGAIMTAVLFTIGKHLIGLYLGTASVGSAYGAAASLVVLLLWIYYSSQIMLFGAEFTQVYTRWHVDVVKPKQHAESLTEDSRLKEGIPHKYPQYKAGMLVHKQTNIPAARLITYRMPAEPISIRVLSAFLLGLITGAFGIFWSGKCRPS